MDRQLFSSHGVEPVPPPQPGPLFESHEVMAFEQFLDDLAIDNSFMFHPKVPASLTWDGFHSTRNKGFEDIKREVQHTGLQFGSDNHFSAEGYVATHKYVPVGYGHVHPQSTAQRSQRSSASSRAPSRRPSVHEVTNFEPVALASHRDIEDYQSLVVGLPSYLPTGQQPMPFQDQIIQNHVVPEQDFMSPPLQQLQSVQPRHENPIHTASYGRSSATPGSHADDTRSQTGSDGLRPAKKIKLEDQNVGLAGGHSRQPLTAAQKRQNHISSEQKRRNLIKDGFNDLSGLVPRVQNKSESKSVILHEAIKYIRENNAAIDDLRRRLDGLRSVYA